MKGHAPSGSSNQFIDNALRRNHIWRLDVEIAFGLPDGLEVDLFQDGRPITIDDLRDDTSVSRRGSHVRRRSAQTCPGAEEQFPQFSGRRAHDPKLRILPVESCVVTEIHSAGVADGVVDDHDLLVVPLAHDRSGNGIERQFGEIPVVADIGPGAAELVVEGFGGGGVD